MIAAFRYLAAAGFDALAEITTPVADAIWDEARRRDIDELAALHEVAAHAAACRHLLEDIRNLIASAAPSYLAAAAEGPAPAHGSPGAGHPNPST